MALDRDVVRATRKMVVAALVVLNLAMALLWFGGPSDSSRRPAGALAFWIGSNAALAAAWIAGAIVLRRGRR